MSDTVDVKEKTKLVAIDINDARVPDGQEQIVDTTADAYDIPMPVPKGIYEFNIFLASEGWKLGYEDGKKELPYYQAPLELKVTEETPAWRDRVVFGQVDTRIWSGKTTSTLVTCMSKRGVKNLPAKATPKQWSQMFNKFLNKEPKVYAEVDWQAYSKAEDENILTGMEHFPRNADGTFNHIITDKRGNKCYARARIVRWVSQDDFKKFKANPPKYESKGTTGKPATAVGLDDDMDFGGSTVVSPASKPPVVDDDMGL